MDSGWGGEYSPMLTIWLQHLENIYPIKYSDQTINILYMKTEKNNCYLANDFQSQQLLKNESDYLSKLPLPKGNSPYAMAKRAEYIQKDLELAKHYYRLALKRGDRGESAIKDIASILHQEGLTTQACDFLSEHQAYFKDHKKFENLLTSLQKQIIPSENCLKRILKLYPVTEQANAESVRNLFKNSIRVLEVEFHFQNNQRAAFLKFQSHSSARKTLEGLLNWDHQKVEWVSQQELEDITNLEFWTFALDSQWPSLSRGASTDEDTARQLIGADLLLALTEA